MSERDAIVLFACVVIAAAGLYVMSAPRHLFTRAEDPARYRPYAVEYDSPQGVRMRRFARGYAVVAPLVLLAYWLAGGFRG
jgi:hypothetical protein